MNSIKNCPHCGRLLSNFDISQKRCMICGRAFDGSNDKPPKENPETIVSKKPNRKKTKEDRVNKLNILSVDSEYLEIIGSGTSSTIGGIIRIDAGVPKKSFPIVIDEEGTEVTFSTMIEALNFFNKRGYELISAYGAVDGMMVQSNYVLRKNNL